MPGIGLGISKAIKGSGLNYEPELVTYITGLNTPLSTVQKVRLNTLIRSLKSGLAISALSDAFDVMYILGGETAESSLKNLAKNAHHGTAVNSPAFVAFEGFTGNGTTSYIKTNYNPSSQGVAYTLNSASIGVYSRTDIDGALVSIGARVTFGDDMAYLVLRSANALFHPINQDSTTDISVENTSSTGLYVTTRTSSIGTNVYKNKSPLNPSFQISSTIPNLEMYCCGYNNNGTASYDVKQQALVFFGKGLTQANVNVITDAFEAYMDSNGKGVIA